MNYSALRLQIYRNEIKQLTDAIGQLGLFIAVVCYNVVIPGFLMFGLMAVAVIAEDVTTLDQRIRYQVFYLMAIYGLLRIQRKAILATPYRHYINDLPVSTWMHRRCELELTAVAGNLILFAPLVLCFFIPDWQTLVKTAYFPVFAVTVLLTSLLAVYRNNMPIFSWLLLPLAGYSLAPSANVLNAAWLLLVALEWQFIDKLKMQLPDVKLTSYPGMLWRFVAHRPVNVLTRIGGTIAIMAGFAFLISKRPDFATEMFAIVISLPIAMLIGSYQFEIERWRSQYHYYLNDLPISPLARHVWDTLPMVVFTTVVAAAYLWLLDINALMVVLLGLLVAATAVGVNRLGKFYFFLPCVVFGLWVGLIG